jgi:hypothetical protein
MTRSTLTAGVAGLLVIAPLALAQQALYAQCGGIGWTGGTVSTFNVANALHNQVNAYIDMCLWRNLHQVKRLLFPMPGRPLSQITNTRPAHDLCD